MLGHESRALGGDRRALSFFLYAGLIAGSVAIVQLIHVYGASLPAPSPLAAADASSPVHTSTTNAVFALLIALATLVAAGRLLGRLLAALGQPPVIGEIVAGILLGPSFLGHIAPTVSHFLIPPAVLPLLNGIAQLGVILYMFRIGLELDGDLLAGRAHAAIATSHASILVPFVLGTGLALLLYPRFAPSDVPFTSFSLFMGVGMSVTAFPVLARILTDRGLIRTELGAVALTCAAVDDATAWCLLAFVVGVTQSSVHDALTVLLLAAVFVPVMLGGVRPLLARLLHAPAAPSGDLLALVLTGVLVSALITEGIGLHAVFGAFLFGVAVPRGTATGRWMTQQIDALVGTLLLPAYFGVTGLRTQIGLMASPETWLMCGLITATATIGKLGGTLVAARYGGMAWRPALTLGMLMNTRGLMELIILNIGLELGILSPQLFTMMVIMALATTFATSPAVRWLASPRSEYCAAAG